MKQDEKLTYLIVDDNEGVVAICDTSEKAGELYDKWVYMCDGAPDELHILLAMQICLHMCV